MQARKQQLELDMEQQTGSKSGKEYFKALYCHQYIIYQYTRLYIGAGVCQGCILSFNLYAEYIMWNARLDEAQAEIKIARGNISNFRYADDTTLVIESKEEMKSLLMKVKEESGKKKTDFKLNIQKLRTWQLVPSLHGK